LLAGIKPTSERKRLKKLAELSLEQKNETIKIRRGASEGFYWRKTPTKNTTAMRATTREGSLGNCQSIKLLFPLFEVE